MLIVSQEFYERLIDLNRKIIPDGMGFFGCELFGEEIRVSHFLPHRTQKRTGKIIQLDRFAEYAEGDMDWAEAAGLAAWETVEEIVHAYKVNPPKFDFSVRSTFSFGDGLYDRRKHRNFF